MSIPIWAMAILSVGAGAIVFLVHRHHRQRRGELKDETARRIEELRREQTKQVERLRRERDRAERTGHVAFVEDLLPALDGLRRAAREVRDESGSREDLAEGVEMTLRQVETVLDRYDVERIDPDEGDAFDPEFQEAVRAVDDTEADPGSVVTCHRAGYRYEERTIRPAMVEVAVGSEADDDGADEAGERATADASKSSDEVVESNSG